MRVGTKSLLFGVHQFAIHPFFVALAWVKLYGFPWDPRLWVAFFVHDLGYWGCPNMDGPEGERHVELGARWMRKLFGNEWGWLCLFHSRFYAKQREEKPSRLCYADKLSIALTPWFVYLPLAYASGEIWEYRERAGQGKYQGQSSENRTGRLWLADLQRFIRQWVGEHKDE